jgi:glycerophosphoryl diester phosphodiesterase
MDADAGELGRGGPPGAAGATGAMAATSARRARAALPRRVGHKGAAHIAPGNTLASFKAAIEAGVDMIEFDVLSERPDGTGRLLLAHDYEDMREREPITLEEGLEHLAGSDYHGIELDVDVKLPGYGARVVSALRDTGLSERSLVSCTFMRELLAIRELAPALRLGWSVPRVRRDYTKDVRTVLPALVALGVLRAAMPRRARGALDRGRCDAIMAHWRLVTPALVAAVSGAGGELYVWTVDETGLLDEMARLGAHGIITNDPRLFLEAGPESSAAGTATGAAEMPPNPEAAVS